MRVQRILGLCACALVTAHLPFAAATVAQVQAPIMGFSTWNYFAQNINETLMHEVADALVASGLAGLGFTWVNIDDGWAEENRDPTTQQIVASKTKFPSGMLALSQRLGSQGLRLGLYTARANRTCGGQMPGSLGHEALDAQTFQAMGAGFLKNDDCHVIYAHAAQDYGAMEAAIAALSKPMIHNVKAPDLDPQQAPKVCQFRRVGKDLKNDWYNMVRVLDTGTDDAFAAIAGRNFFNDFDMLEVGNTAGLGMTHSEYEAHFSLWAALKSPLVLGNDVRHMPPDVLSILNNPAVIAINQDPLGQQVRRVAIQAAAHDNTTTKTYLAPCAQPGDPLFARQQWDLQSAGDDLHHIIARGDGRCLEVFNCELRWPWWISVSPCGAPSCAATGGNSWRMDGERLQSALSGTCWPGKGGEPGASGCCLSAEGSNPEIDQCGWMVDPPRQAWRVNGSTGQIVSGMAAGQCLTLAGNLDVYAGPLANNTFTVLLFNRSPQPMQGQVALQSIPGWPAGAGRATDIRDLLARKALPDATRLFSANVPSHAVVHVTMRPDALS